MKINKHEKIHIIIPAEATIREKFAADELRKYIFKMFGTKIIVTDDNLITGDSCFLIGGPERNKRTVDYFCTEEFKKTVSGPEGIIIKSLNDNCILLAGSDDEESRERGTIYAVYEFLERYLGMSFVAYGKPGDKIGEFIPKKEEIIIDDIEYIKPSADLEYRAAIVQFNGYAHKNSNSDPDHSLTKSFIDWIAKNRQNRIILPMKSYEQIKRNGILDEIIKRGILITSGHHDSSMFFLPPSGNSFFEEKYYETNPDYYKLTSENIRFCAKSKWEGQWIFDSRNKDCINRMAENILKWLDENEYVDVVNLWPNDMDSEQCTCEECSKHTKTSNYSYFVNEVAKKVALKKPNVKIDMLVYLDLWEPPNDVILEDNVLVEVATWGPNMFLRRFGTNDGTGIIGTMVEKNAIAWNKIAKNVVFYDYYMANFRSRQVYCPMGDEIIKVYEQIAKQKYCLGTGTQIEAFNIWNYLFNFYIHGRKGYDVNLTMSDLLEKFTKIFGKAQKFVKQYLEYVEEFCDGQIVEGRDGRSCAGLFAKNVDKERVYNLFEKAYEADSNEDIRDNLRMMRMVFRYSDIVTNEPENSELSYMYKFFGSYWGCEGQIGYGISIFEKPEKDDFSGNKWYAIGGSNPGHPD